MSRNGSGTWSVPAGQPVVTGTVIAAATFNTLVNDIGTEVTDSLSRSAKGAMLGILQLHDGTSATVPDLTWSGDTDTGLGHSGANILDIIAGGTTVCAINASGFGAFTSTALISTTVAGSSLSQTTADTALIITGNRSAASTGNADVRLCSTATRSAGNLLDVVNNATMKLAVDFSGQIKWPSGPASTSTTPAPSAITAITYSASWSGGLFAVAAYWKDPMGIVHIRGAAKNNTGGASSTPFSGTSLPAGFRPTTSLKVTATDDASPPNAYQLNITSTGGISVANTTVPNGNTLSLEGISFLAEA